MIFLSRILYWLVIIPVSLLPYPLLYGFSNFLFVVLSYIFPYRKKVVMDNLRGCYPDKSEAELTAIARKFYRHFCDLIVESIKNFTISGKQAHKRMIQENAEIMNAYFESGRSVILTGGHYGNWELWAVAAKPVLKHRLIGIYKKLSNPYFDRKMRSSRGKFGLELLATKKVGDYMRTHQDDVDAVVFAVDQSPSNPEKCVWINFMGRETAALFGAEKYACTYNRPVVWAHMTKLKRGYYKVNYELVTDKPQETRHGEITEKLHQILESDISKAPEFWLWTHKRWKHRRKV